MYRDETRPTPFPPMPINERGVGICWGCQTRGTWSCQLGVETVEVCQEERSITSLVTCPSRFQGGPEVAHGGWISMVFDDVLGTLPLRVHIPCVTAKLTVEFRKPVPINRQLTVVGRVGESDGRRWQVTGTMSLVSSPDIVVAAATGHFVEPRLDHFERHRHRLQEIDGG